MGEEYLGGQETDTAVTTDEDSLINRKLIAIERSLLEGKLRMKQIDTSFAMLILDKFRYARENHGDKREQAFKEILTLVEGWAYGKKE